MLRMQDYRHILHVQFICDFCWIGHGSWLQEDQVKENENRGALRETQRRGAHQSPYYGSHNMEKQEDQRPHIFTLVEDSGLAAIELRNGNASQTLGDRRGRIHMVRACRSPKLQD